MRNDVLSRSNAAGRFGKALKRSLSQGAMDQKTGNDGIACSRVAQITSEGDRIICRPAEGDYGSIIIHRNRIKSRPDLGIGSRRNRGGDPAREVVRILGDSLIAEIKVQRAPIDVQGDSAALCRSLTNGPAVSRAI